MERSPLVRSRPRPESYSPGRFSSPQVAYNLLNRSAAVEVPEGFCGQDFGRLAAVRSRLAPIWAPMANGAG